MYSFDIDNLKKARDIDPYEDDKSYILVKESVEAMARLERDDLSVADLDFLYGMCLGSWVLGREARLKRIRNSSLLEEDKERLEKLLDQCIVWSEKNKAGDLGMFGTGFYRFRTDDETARKFLGLCIDIKDLNDDDEILEISDRVLSSPMPSIQSASASIILHCLKPLVFPVLNSVSIGNIGVLEEDGLFLKNPKKLENYIENTRRIKVYRDKNTNFKNYRVMDKFLWEKDEDKEPVVHESSEEKEDHDKTIGKKRLDAIVDAFKLVGGSGKVKDIFEIVKNDERFEYERFKDDRSAEGTIRYIIQTHSQDSSIYKEGNEPIFISLDGIGIGKWALKSESLEEEEAIDFSKDLDFEGLYFEREDILKKQISAALSSGKNIILIGPPGTGKSKLAKAIVKSYGVDYKMVTAMSDWSSYDTIGGYKPSKDNSGLYFDQGIFLSCLKSQGRNINKWLIIDEINRADIDKAFGPFFSALSGDSVDLSLKDDESRNIRLLRQSDPISEEDQNYIIPDDWRIIASMNSFDKTSLYEMSYAFMRRFAFIPVSIPREIDADLMEKFFGIWELDLASEKDNMAKLWKTINKYRQLGPALMEDIARFIEGEGDYCSAISLYVLPQLEGLFDRDLKDFLEEMKDLDFIEDHDRLFYYLEDFFNIRLSGD